MQCAQCTSCSHAHTRFLCQQVALQDHFARMLQISSGARLKAVSYEPVRRLHAQTANASNSLTTSGTAITVHGMRKRAEQCCREQT